MRSVEFSIASEAKRFIKKDPSKLPLVASLYASSIAVPSSGRLARATYFFIRHLDDVLDGEMSSSHIPEEAISNPVDYARDLQQQILGNTHFDKTPIANMGRYAITGLQKQAHPDEDPRFLLSGIINGMIFDNERRMQRKASSRDELMGYYALFNDFMDVALMGLGEDERTSSFPMFGFSQGRLYSVRDIRKDWALGIVNIPSDVMNESGVSPIMPIDDVVSNPSMQSWMNTEIQDGIQGMSETLDILKTLKGARPTKTMVGGLAKGAMKRLTLIKNLKDDQW